MLLDPQGFVAEGSGENVFIVLDGELHTPDLSSARCEGITRDTIITFARELGIPVHERRITATKSICADEAFFTGTAAEVTPIRELDNRTIGTGVARPGHGAAAGAVSSMRCNGARSEADQATWLSRVDAMTDAASAASRSSRPTCRCIARTRRCRCGRRIRACFSKLPKRARRCARIAARATYLPAGPCPDTSAHRATRYA